MAERQIVLRRLNSSRAVMPFNPDDAAYYVEGVDPPLTASIRTSLTALQAYNAALSALSNGESAAAVTNRMGVITSNVSSAISAVSAVGGGLPSNIGASAFAGVLGNALRSLSSPLASEVLAIAARESFRQRLLNSYPEMREVLRVLRDEGTPTMFRVLERSRVTPGTETATGLTSEGARALAADRQLLSGWVLLIDQTLIAMDAAAVAAAQQMSPTDLVALSESAIELRILAEKVRALGSQ